MRFRLLAMLLALALVAGTGEAMARGARGAMGGGFGNAIVVPFGSFNQSNFGAGFGSNFGNNGVLVTPVRTRDGRMLVPLVPVRQANGTIVLLPLAGRFTLERNGAGMLLVETPARFAAR
jgi:hypothetical protein